MKIFSLVIVLFLTLCSYAQNIDSIRIRAIYDEALSSLKSYQYLKQLCKGVGHRLTASPNSYKAVDWGYELMQSLQPDTVYKQEIIVPHWVRGEKSIIKIKGQQILKLNKCEPPENLEGSKRTPIIQTIKNP